jgi:flavin-dependent dehydrogenase
MNLAQDELDVIVVGGGPAGASTAGLLALQGHQVLLLEREKMPRYHIGESLITGVVPTLNALGLRERMDHMGFQRKYGGSILWGSGQTTPWSFRFREIRNGKYEYAYQVRRADFDALLFDRARELGVAAVEGATVREPLFHGERIVGVRFQLRGESTPVDVRARMVVDASGQNRWLGRHFDLVSWYEDLRNVAVWSYYQGGLRYDGEFEGDLLSELRPDGWLWYAPLNRDITGIGYVTPSARLVASGMPPELMLDKQIAESTEVSWLTANARRVDIYRTARDWSYACTRFSGPGWVLVGDAAAFIDPLLSAGVTLAMRGANSAAQAVHEALIDPDKERDTMRAYEQRYREFLEALLSLTRFLYEGAKEKHDFHLRAQSIIDPAGQLPTKVAFVTLLSGLVRGDEAIELGD